VVQQLVPKASERALEASRSLRYRDFLVVALIARDRHVFDDNWLYIQDAGVKVGRIQNFKSWSPEMVPDETMNCYGLEYFCFEGDGLWTSRDDDLVSLATRELCDELGLAQRSDVTDGCVVRMKKAYPVYDDHYGTHVGTIRDAIANSYAGLHFVGRNGMHKYNNQDHSMMTAMLVAQNIALGKRFDPWCVNQDAEYHEGGTAGSDESWSDAGRAVPRRKQS
jgi:protoporphyrinogen oxidase